jgi:predicted nucleic acid-binding protein
LRGSLVDSNILVYAFDASEHGKQARAAEVLERLTSKNLAILSVQCLTEFFNTVRSARFARPLSNAQAIEQVELLSRSCVVLDLTELAVLEACRGAVEHKMSLWGALIWSVAKLNQVTSIITEDVQHGRSIEGVRYLNPFQPDFDIEAVAGGA